MEKMYTDEESGEGQQRLLPDARHDPKNFPSNSAAQSRNLRTMLWLTLFNVVLFGFSATILLRQNKSNNLVELRSAFSPMYTNVQIPTETIQMNGTLFTPDSPPDICRMEPGPSTDRLWDDISYNRYVPLKASDILAMGKNPAMYAKLQPYDHPTRGVPEDTENDPRYFGQLDVFHKLHCLNELRKGTFEQYWGPRYVNRTRLYWQHKAHCVSMLFQDLKCNANGDLVPAYWLRLGDGLMHDFSIQRKCANWDAIVAWRNKYGLSMDEYEEWGADLILKPKEGEGTLNDNPEGYYRLWGPDGRDKSKNVWDVQISDEEVAQRVLQPL